MLTPADKRAAFKKLHESGCFIIPIPFDVGSARALQHLGFKALASTSAGFAWTHRQGRQPRHRRRCLRSSHRDLRGGRYSRQCRFRGRLCPRARQGRRQCRPSREDRRSRPFDRGFYRRQRKAAVRSRARDRSHQGGATGDRCRQQRVLLTGRCEAFLRGQKDLKLVIDRLTAYAEAGADCLYAPGIATAEEISAVVKAVHPGRSICWSARPARR